MRKKIIAGNWKMNLSLNEANELHEAIEKLNSSDNQFI
jgi:triosephosphate isomerase